MDALSNTAAHTRTSKKDRTSFLLAELRCAALRARIWQADIEAVGLALKHGLIHPEQALELLHDCHCLHLVEAIREEASA